MALNTTGPRLLALVLAALAWMFIRNSEAAQVEEYLVKAAFMHKVAKFVEWPASSFASPSTPIRVCVIGDDPFDTALESIEKKVAQQRYLEVQRIRRVESIDGCHILFVSASERGVLAPIQARSRKASVLTISDMDGFAQAGGMIQLLTDEGRIRFDINLESVQQSGLRISSNVLRLARQIHDSGR